MAMVTNYRRADTIAIWTDRGCHPSMYSQQKVCCAGFRFGLGDFVLFLIGAKYRSFCTVVMIGALFRAAVPFATALQNFVASLEYASVACYSGRGEGKFFFVFLFFFVLFGFWNHGYLIQSLMAPAEFLACSKLAVWSEHVQGSVRALPVV
jgi:hypothetical protein